jgi:cob(I)alamin adenosyltransferase
MGTKNKPGDFDCYANAEPDEPMFVLLGRDPSAADLVYDWAARYAERKAPMTKEQLAKYNEALKCATSMEAWAKRKSL